MCTKNKKEIYRDISNGNFLVVMENDTCPHWEPAGDTNLIPMRECWYCKFSDFRNETKEHRTYSICRRPKTINSINSKE